MGGDLLYRFDLTVDSDGAPPLRTTLRLARHPSEDAQRVVLRVLAWLVFGDASAVFSPGLCRGDEAPLALPGDGPRARLWIEVGSPRVDRIERALRRADAVAVLARAGWLASTGARLAGREVRTVEVSPAAVDELAERLERRSEWNVARSSSELVIASAAWRVRVELSESTAFE